MGATRHTAKVLGSIERCARSGAASLTACIASDAERGRRDRERIRWGEKAAAACAAVGFVTELGYLDTCSAPPSGCVFPTTAIDAAGPANDLLDCLACQVEEQLGGVSALLFADRGIDGACQKTLGGPGLHILRMLIARIEHCLHDGKAESIAVWSRRSGARCARDVAGGRLA